MSLEELRESTRATVTIKDAAAIAGVDPRTLTAELSVNGGAIPARRIGRRVVIPREPFLTWLTGEAAAPADDEASSRPSIDVSQIVRAKLFELIASIEGV